MNITVKVPESSIDHLLAGYRERSEVIDHEIFDLKEEQADLKEAIASIEQELQLRHAAGPAKLKRAKKGENLRMIREFFKGNGNKAAGFTAISKATGIKVSSVQSTLSKNLTIFNNGDGLWNLK